MELSQNKLKFITSLHAKKNREEENVFIAEGLKVINDLIKFGFIPQTIAYNPTIWKKDDFEQSQSFCDYYTTSNSQDKKLSLLSTPSGVIAVFIKPILNFDKEILLSLYIFLLDNISDPGNLGTIIRTAHWFGIHHLFITNGSVEVFNPKVVQASMGSLAAVKVHVVDSLSFIQELQLLKIPIYIADMHGKDAKTIKITKPACFVFGNESHGISQLFRNAANETFTIKAINTNNQPESLNLSISTAIFMEMLTRD